MKIYKVETVTIAKKYASTTVEAESEKQAIEKAKDIRWDDFDENETTNQSEWTAKTEWSFYKFLESLFRG
tara:strand:+ start:51 stop:260 length:210 start_codon:yes stop_codon:yes gene_type:complete